MWGLECYPNNGESKAKDGKEIGHELEAGLK